MSLKSHLLMDVQKRSGILILIILIAAGLAIYIWVDFSPEVDYNKERVVIIQRQIDSIKAAEKQVKKPDFYPFNPNFISDYKGYTLGMSPEEIDKLHRFRESDNWINSAADFKRVTGVSDSLLADISPYFKFPEWVTSSNSQNKSAGASKENPKKALNKITHDELMSIKGMTQKAARDILYFRKRIGGFLEDNQLFDVYGVPNKVVYAIKDKYTVKNEPQIEMLNVNTASASDLSTLPYITFEVAKEIVDYRLLNEGIEDLDELNKIQGITPYKFDRIKLYLSTNQN